MEHIYTTKLFVSPEIQVLGCPVFHLGQTNTAHIQALSAQTQILDLTRWQRCTEHFSFTLYNGNKLELIPNLNCRN